ncbi:hypothetical protein ACQKWADRAFT_313653 [Trichoderma austrokoningii]
MPPALITLFQALSNDKAAAPPACLLALVARFLATAILRASDFTSGLWYESSGIDCLWNRDRLPAVKLGLGLVVFASSSFNPPASQRTLASAAINLHLASIGAPEPTAPEALAGATTLETVKPGVSENPSAQAEPAKELPIIGETKPSTEPFNLVDAFKKTHQIPRPVEVQSVPETPANQSVNGSPKPELNIPMDTEEPPKAQDEAVVITGVEEPLPTPAASAPNSDIGPDSIVDKPVTPNGESKTAEMAGALQTGNDDDKSDVSEIVIGEKRKLAEGPADVPATSSAAAEKEDSDESEPADKKAKIDDGEASSNGGAPRKPGRPKKNNGKEKKAVPPPAVGKTARKTRSQGPVEA